MEYESETRGKSRGKHAQLPGSYPKHPGSPKGFLNMFVMCALVLLAFSCVRIVPPAHTAVVSYFGTVSTTTLRSGPTIVLPWGSLVLFTLKTQLLDSQNQVPTQEGLNVELDVSILYHIQPSAARELYLTLGTNYQEVLIKPELASAVRGLTSEQSAKALYTSGRRTIQTNLKQELVKKFESRGIILEDVLLKAIVLPKMLTDAIEVKAQAEQESARMEFVLSKEEAEAKRKQIEAKGIQSFQKIVSEGISKELLMWKGIEATEKLAASKNAKIVMMGNNDKSMPVLFSANELPGKSN